MNKKFLVIALALLIIPTFVFAAFKPATLVSGLHKVAVYSQEQANAYFGMGYVLEGQESLGALTSPVISSKYLSVGGVTTYYLTGNLMDASTTLVSIKNPFGTAATATIDMMKFVVTGPATSSATLTCGANPSENGTNAYTLLTGVLATSTTVYMENNLTAALGGSADAGSVAKIALNATNPYLVCKIAALGGVTTPYTRAGNTFAGTYTIKITR
jgi:hypothetical protein